VQAQTDGEDDRRCQTRPTIGSTRRTARHAPPVSDALS
jgi:hypothetical protein